MFTFYAKTVSSLCDLINLIVAICFRRNTIADKQLDFMEDFIVKYLFESTESLKQLTTKRRLVENNMFMQLIKFLSKLQRDKKMFTGVDVTD